MHHSLFAMEPPKVTIEKVVKEEFSKETDPTTTTRVVDGERSNGVVEASKEAEVTTQPKNKNEFEGKKEDKEPSVVNIFVFPCTHL